MDLIFNKNSIDSSIKKDEGLKLYRIDISWIDRYFESIIFSYNWKNIIYWNQFSQYNLDFIDFDNYIIWITKFFDFKIICFINLKDLENKYFFIKDFAIFDFKILWKKYFCFIYKDYKWKISFFSNLSLNRFSINLINNSIIVKNNIFNTITYKKDLDKIEFKDSVKWFVTKKIENKNDFLDIADFYIFDNYFLNSDWYDDLSNFINNFKWEEFTINEEFSFTINSEYYDDLFFPKIKLNLKIKQKDSYNLLLSEFRKLMLSFYRENSLAYYINSDKINNYFWKYIEDISNYKISEIPIDFEIPKNIFNFDKKYKDFMYKLNILSYNYFELENSLKKLINNDININKPYIKLSKQKKEIFIRNLKNSIKIYKAKLDNFFWLIKNIKNKQL